MLCSRHGHVFIDIKLIFSIKSAETKPTVLIGDDTDLLVLLLANADLSHEPVFFAPEPKKNVKKSSLEYGTFIF